jgi:hypothetical protein
MAPETTQKLTWRRFGVLFMIALALYPLFHWLLGPPRWLVAALVSAIVVSAMDHVGGWAYRKFVAVESPPGATHED